MCQPVVRLFEDDGTGFISVDGYNMFLDGPIGCDEYTINMTDDDNGFIIQLPNGREYVVRISVENSWQR